ncbi:hypothetical protein O181_019065 [Austropuccinia psidii MF-1]|uniref:Uncharacterized protein n=1 Tax=Austropuccinia psidii MF-1 TaxID=1389203 RepID=A0A9Q3GUN1_9BASI|nr:hypothetical protein [Austropuccinia psidii MF-1]
MPRIRRNFLFGSMARFLRQSWRSRRCWKAVLASESKLGPRKMLRRFVADLFKGTPKPSTTPQDPEILDLDALTKRAARRRWIISSITSFIPLLSSLLITAGFVAGLLLPTSLWSRSTYISENAILPAQVNAYWNWPQVHQADRYADRVAEWTNLPADQRAERIRQVFESFGLRSETQSYAFNSLATHQDPISNGTNVHSILYSPRTDGSESLVLMASWLTRRPGSDVHGGNVNIRGVASVLALAEFLKTFNLWSKDIIFLIADEFLEGTHAWLKAYHGDSQSNLKMDTLDLKTGSIWAALNLDYPFHSFSHIGIEYEGINGQLPNLDLINSVAHIVRWTGTCPVTIHDQPLEPNYPSYLPNQPKLRDYLQASRTIIRQMTYGLMGTPSGPEGLFSTYRIDAIALFAHPADGPHGFYTIGRTIESSLRSLNNLLERLHQSFFLYLLQSEEMFLSVAMYLIVPLLIGVGLTLKGLGKWAESLGDTKLPLKWSQRQKGAEILWSLRVIAFTHLLSALIFWGVVRSIKPIQATESKTIYGLVAFFSILPFLIVKSSSPSRFSLSIFEPIHLMLAGCLVSVMSVLNFSLGTGMGIFLGSPLGPLLGSWLLAFGFTVLIPLFVQTGVVRLLSWQCRNAKQLESKVKQ